MKNIRFPTYEVGKFVLVSDLRQSEPGHWRILLQCPRKLRNLTRSKLLVHILTDDSMLQEELRPTEERLERLLGQDRELGEEVEVLRVSDLEQVLDK